MTTDDKIRDEKLQYDTNREAAKISGKLININILQVKKYYLLIKENMEKQLFKSGDEKRSSTHLKKNKFSKNLIIK